MFNPSNREKILKEKNPIYLNFDEKGNLYIGQVKTKKDSQPLKEGLGLSIKSDKEIFHGIFKNGLKSHLGFLQKTGDFLYIGEFDQGNVAGYGQMRKSESSNFYIGGMKNNQKCGFGIEKSDSGWIIGQYVRDQIRGFAELYDKDKICKF